MILPYIGFGKIYQLLHMIDADYLARRPNLRSHYKNSNTYKELLSKPTMRAKHAVR